MTQIKKYLKFLWHRHIEPKDPFNLQLKHALKTLLALLITIAAAMFLKIPEGSILVFATMFIMLMYQGCTPRMRIMQQLCGGFASVIGMFIASLIGGHLLLFVLLMFSATFTAFYLIRFGQEVFVTAFLVLMLILLGGSIHTTFEGAVIRTINTLLAAISAILVSNLIWPYRPRQYLRQNLRKGLNSLSQYIKFILDDSLRGNYHRHLRYEKKNKILHVIQTSHKLANKYATKHEQQLQELLEQLFIEIVALGDILNKPISEYSLDEVTTKLSHITPKLIRAMKQPHEKLLIKLEAEIATLTTIDNRLYNKDFIHYDASYIQFLLTTIINTLKQVCAIKYAEI